MPKATLTPIQLQDRVKLRKPHACGSYEWTIVRLGADIGLTCNQCGRRVLLPRMEFERRLTAHVSKQDQDQDNTQDQHRDKDRDKPATKP